jgi:hypothetical protein
MCRRSGIEVTDREKHAFAAESELVDAQAVFAGGELYDLAQAIRRNLVGRRIS